MNEENIKHNLIKDCKVLRWPKKLAEKRIILEYISDTIPYNITFSEKEINEIIIKTIAFDDFVLIRRELIENNYLKRTPDCRKYWRENVD